MRAERTEAPRLEPESQPNLSLGSPEASMSSPLGCVSFLRLEPPKKCDVLLPHPCKPTPQRVPFASKKRKEDPPTSASSPLVSTPKATRHPRMVEKHPKRVPRLCLRRGTHALAVLGKPKEPPPIWGSLPKKQTRPDEPLQPTRRAFVFLGSSQKVKAADADRLLKNSSEQNWACVRGTFLGDEKGKGKTRNPSLGFS